MHKTRIRTIISLSHEIEGEKKEISIRKTTRNLLQKADEECPLIDFSSYVTNDLMVYLLSLQTKDKTRLSSVSYSRKRSGFYHYAEKMELNKILSLRIK